MDLTKLICALCDYANAPEIKKYLQNVVRRKALQIACILGLSVTAIPVFCRVPLTYGRH